MANIFDHVQRSFLDRSHSTAERDEFKSHMESPRRLGLPNFPKPTVAEARNERVAGDRFQVGLQGREGQILVLLGQIPRQSCWRFVPQVIVGWQQLK